jgi:hypothetical protein
VRLVVLARAQRAVTFAWAAAAAGAGLGFVARDLLGLPAPLVALAWIAGAALGVASVCWLPPPGDGGS